MIDLDVALFEAWERVGPRLLEDPEELRRRLERRKSKQFIRPLRAECVTVRASDLRINDTWAVITPRHPISLEADAHPGRYAEHTVRLEKPLLERICPAVEIARPGEPHFEVAKRLGCRPEDLKCLRRNGFLRTTPKPRLRGRPGKPVPLIYTQELLDPQARGRAGADDIFACSWRHNHEMVPEGFMQTVTRIPRYGRNGGREQFWGWYWVCPCCRKNAKILYYPTDQMDFPSWVGFAPAKAEPLPKTAPIFACKKCHGVLNFSRAKLTQDWGLLILRLSGGLMYGSEVKKPEWLKPARKREYRPRWHAPVLRRERIERLLVETDLPQRQIAAELNVSCRAVNKQACIIFKRHKVHSRAELKAVLRPAEPERALAAAG